MTEVKEVCGWCNYGWNMPTSAIDFGRKKKSGECEKVSGMVFGTFEF